MERKQIFALAAGIAGAVLIWRWRRSSGTGATGLSNDWPVTGDESWVTSEARTSETSVTYVSGGAPQPKDLRFVPVARLNSVLSAIRQAHAEAAADPRLSDDLPPIAWFIAIAAVESAFDPRAHRPGSRYYGLYQFSEPLARDLGWRGRSMEDLFNPLTSSRLMARAFVYYVRRARRRCGEASFGDAAAKHNKGGSVCLANAPSDFHASYLPQALVELERAERELV